MAQVAIDLIPPESLLSQLHHSQQILDFLAAVIGAPVYRNLYTGPSRYFDERAIRTPDSPASVRLR